MNKIFKLTLFFFLIINFINSSFSEENFFDEGLKLYKDKKYEDARFMFERGIVFNPKDSKSYLYLAKIYKLENNEKFEEQNLNTVILLNPKNEEAIYLLALLKIKQSDFSKSNNLINTLMKICKNFCGKEKELNVKLKNLQPG